MLDLAAVRLERVGVDELRAAAAAPDAVDLLRRVAPRYLLAVPYGDVPRRGLERRARAVERLRSGGSASLHANDPEDPFLGGVAFHATPPGKRFCEISQLSGGEWRRVALGLSLAFSDFVQQRGAVSSNLLVLDETARVARLGRGWTEESLVRRKTPRRAHTPTGRTMSARPPWIVLR